MRISTKNLDLRVESAFWAAYVAPRAVSAPGLEDVSRTVAGINVQTRAVDEAVAEILTG
jgi:hypothetical protein